MRIRSRRSGKRALPGFPPTGDLRRDGVAAARCTAPCSRPMFPGCSWPPGGCGVAVDAHQIGDNRDRHGGGTWAATRVTLTRTPRRATACSARWRARADRGDSRGTAMRSRRASWPLSPPVGPAGAAWEKGQPALTTNEFIVLLRRSSASPTGFVVYTAYPVPPK
jgi:hypothetical protein